MGNRSLSKSKSPVQIWAHNSKFEKLGVFFKLSFCGSSMYTHCFSCTVFLTSHNKTFRCLKHLSAYFFTAVVALSPRCQYIARGLYVGVKPLPEVPGDALRPGHRGQRVLGVRQGAGDLVPQGRHPPCDQPGGRQLVASLQRGRREHPCRAHSQSVFPLPAGGDEAEYR